MVVVRPAEFEESTVPDHQTEPQHERRHFPSRGIRPPPRGEHRAPFAVWALGCVVAISATVWSARTQSMLLYGDARAHLDVSRHVTDGLRPGVTQLGSVWLPMPHLLMVPFSALRPLWRSGAAGAIVGGACFIYAAARIFTLVEELTDDRLAAWIGFVLFAANLNLLYLQTTALTEPVLIAFLVGATYHLALWMRTFSVRALMWAALLTLFATLTRYEGWALLFVGVIIVFTWSVHADRRRKSPEANVVLYSMVGVYGIVLWLIYNLTIFGDAFYFLNSAYSAQAINGPQARFGLLGTKGNIAESVLTYGWDALDVLGPAAAIAALVAAAVVLLRRTNDRRRIALTFALLFAPIGFEVLSLYFGQTTIRVPERAPYGMWNDRYGVIAMPLCAVAIATLLGRRRVLGALAAASALVGLAAIAVVTPLTLADGRMGTSSATGGHPELAAAYLHKHYRGGEVLADDAAVSSFVFAANLDLKDFVTPGFHPYWERALAAPAENVRWVVAVPGDAIMRDLDQHPTRFTDFRLAFEDASIKIYRSNPRRSSSLADFSTSGR